jgi:hypothetical protein
MSMTRARHHGHTFYTLEVISELPLGGKKDIIVTRGKLTKCKEYFDMELRGPEGKEKK